MIPGWPYSVISTSETGRSSWATPLDAARLAPDDDATTVTADQLRTVIVNLIDAGHHWRPGDPDIWIVADAGYDAPRLAFLLADLPVAALGRMRSDRVLRRAAPPRLPGTNGRPPPAENPSWSINYPSQRNQQAGPATDPRPAQQVPSTRHP
jgi:hypothetical protein